MSAPSVAAVETLIPPTRSLAAGAAMLTGAAAAVAVTATLVNDAFDMWAVVLGTAWAVAFLLAARALLSSRSGLLLDRDRRSLGLCLTSRRDVAWLPLSELLDARAQPVIARGADEVSGWRGVLSLAGGVDVVLVESGSRDFVEALTGELRARLGLEGTRAQPAFAPGDASWAIRRGAPLQSFVTAFGVALTLTGGAALARGFSGGEPVSAFMLGPLLALAGVALLGVALVKRFGHEVMSFDGLRWRHAFMLGARVVSERTVASRSPVFRLQLLGARGAMLEVVGDDGTLVVAAGATALSDASVATVIGLPRRFAAVVDPLG